MYSRFSELSLHWLAYNFSFFWSVSDLAILRLPVIIFILLSLESYYSSKSWNFPKTGINRNQDIQLTNVQIFIYHDRSLNKHLYNIITIDIVTSYKID